MSYTIDICRGQLKPLNNWADYLFYLSFFPQLVAGPIVRAKDFIPQIRQNPLRVTREMFGMGVFLILIGLFKKPSFRTISHSTSSIVSSTSRCSTPGSNA